MRKVAIIFITVTAWSILVCLHAYYLVSRCMADTNCRDYEGIWILPLMGHILYVFPYWIVGLMVAVICELIFILNHPRVVSAEILKT